MGNIVQISDSHLVRIRKPSRKKTVPLSETLRTISENNVPDKKNVAPPFKLKKRSVDGQGLQNGLSFDNMSAIDDLFYGEID